MSAEIAESTAESAERGQIVVEYFLIFAAIAVLTILGMAWFDDAVRDTLQGVFRQAANRISK